MHYVISKGRVTVRPCTSVHAVTDKLTIKKKERKLPKVLLKDSWVTRGALLAIACRYPDSYRNSGIYFFFYLVVIFSS